MSKVKYIFVDLDKTLLNDEKKVCNKNKEAIDKALSKGHKVIIATGRPKSAAIIGAKNAGLYKDGCFILCYNGGMIYDCTKEQVIFEKTLSMDEIHNIESEADKYGIHVQAYENDKVICKSEDEELKFYCKNGQMGYEIRDSIINTLKSPSLKVLLISFDNEKIVRFRNEHPEFETGSLHSFFSCEEYLEYMPSDISKGDGIVNMSKIFGFDMKDTIAIGDERNDLTMIEMAGLGVAMCNGADCVKDIADYVTTLNNNEGGVAEVIEKFVLNS